jgi:DedD protein
MALFKSRKGGDDAATAPRQPESIEAMRKRARHRLIGAGVLVVIGVLGFPILFDTQPRPIAVDIPIEIPDRDKVKPLQAPKPAGPATAVSGVVTPAPATQAAAGASAVAMASAPAKESAAPAVAPDSKVAAVTAGKAEAKPEPKPEPKAEAKATADTDVKTAEAGKAKVAPDGKAVAQPEGRYVVQVGAFADAARARAVRAKVERAGLKTYTHVAQTKDGKRIRVRVGPFETRSEADKAASKIKGLDMPAAILTL